MAILLRVAQSTGLALSCCRDCGHRFYPPQSFCPTCLAPEVEHLPENGEATVLSTTCIHRTLDPALENVLPLHVACVKTSVAQSLFAMVHAPMPRGTKVRLYVREGLFHAEALS
ncbi:Zn-ribbon domain-containing OB-fold protein [Variovorax sp. GB1P17]|uniref:Zn-ribbon domain-containing OB-fold protein n=1 Tax=Variovorax sp. GB1P17 TaxID=3443740 RepID=UPI003F46EA8E